ncbi:unnamed protein product [Staurois parvus]|uniref:Uncharacterized protein n=1 Tax=Staurois parvus TaxID=386267 RepID=A0ABN9F3Y6_9NEOB|nr:unnamed protein product [Staurois parvus]
MLTVCSGINASVLLGKRCPKLYHPVWGQLGRADIGIGMIRGGLTIWKLGHCPRAQGQ